MNNIVTLSIENLYRSDEPLNDYLVINVDNDENGNPYYYDLWIDGQLVCMDGESCTVLAKENGRVYLLNTEGEEDRYFNLSEHTFAIATETEEELLCEFEDIEYQAAKKEAALEFAQLERWEKEHILRTEHDESLDW